MTASAVNLRAVRRAFFTVVLQPWVTSAIVMVNFLDEVAHDTDAEMASPVETGLLR